MTFHGFLLLSCSSPVRFSLSRQLVWTLQNGLSKPSTDVEPVCSMLQSLGFAPKIMQVEYELQKGGNEMLSFSVPGDSV